MPRYHVTGTVIGSKYLGVFEAETADAAIHQAIEGASSNLCHQCSGECEDGQIEDGEATLIKEEIECPQETK